MMFDTYLIEKILGYRRAYYIWKCPKGITHLYDYNGEISDDLYDDIDTFQCEFCSVHFCICVVNSMKNKKSNDGCCSMCDSIFCPNHFYEECTNDNKIYCLSCVNKKTTEISSEVEKKSKIYKGINLKKKKSNHS